ncbi:hypothetical protein RRG08_064006 [Elysia crispata]|uniref:Uncharacterized protein n=1 Tax=Elysia crispata TaxID=231223 RepID=A0AAE0YEL9_9GAST|nr:hypothetical protein RRG08_064006 [Elysia crispata]
MFVIREKRGFLEPRLASAENRVPLCCCMEQDVMAMSRKSRAVGLRGLQLLVGAKKACWVRSIPENNALFSLRHSPRRLPGTAATPGLPEFGLVRR